MANLQAEFMIATNHFGLSPEQRMWICDAFETALADVGEFVEDGLEDHQGPEVQDGLPNEHPHQRDLNTALENATEALTYAAQQEAGSFGSLADYSKHMFRGSLTVDELAMGLDWDEKINLLDSMAHNHER